METWPAAYLTPNGRTSILDWHGYNVEPTQRSCTCVSPFPRHHSRAALGLSDSILRGVIASIRTTVRRQSQRQDRAIRLCWTTQPDRLGSRRSSKMALTRITPPIRSPIRRGANPLPTARMLLGPAVVVRFDQNHKNPYGVQASVALSSSSCRHISKRQGCTFAESIWQLL